MAPQVGLEPTTLRLTAECSAIELLRIRKPVNAASLRFAAQLLNSNKPVAPGQSLVQPTSRRTISGRTAPASTHTHAIVTGKENLRARRSPGLGKPPRLYPQAPPCASAHSPPPSPPQQSD